MFNRFISRKLRTLTRIDQQENRQLFGEHSSTRYVLKVICIIQEYVEACISRIGKMYKIPKKVLLIGHSIGGLVAKSIDCFGSEADTLITIATPHLMPVVYTDSLVEAFYKNYNKGPNANRFVRYDFTKNYVCTWK